MFRLIFVCTKLTHIRHISFSPPLNFSPQVQLLLQLQKLIDLASSPDQVLMLQLKHMQTTADIFTLFLFFRWHDNMILKLCKTGLLTIGGVL